MVSATLFALSPQFAYGWRRFLLRLFGANIGAGVLVRPTVTVTYPWKLSIGDHAWIGDHVTLYTLGPISVGDNAVISQHAYLCAASHDYSRVDFPIFAVAVCIERECWIATDVYIAPGCTIGAGSVIGARSSVFRNVPPGVVCTGSPARVVRQRKPGEPGANTSGLG